MTKALDPPPSATDLLLHSEHAGISEGFLNCVTIKPLSISVILYVKPCDSLVQLNQIWVEVILSLLFNFALLESVPLQDRVLNNPTIRMVAPVQ